MPFEIPQSWAWTRVKDVFLVNPRNIAEDEQTASFIPMPLICDGFSNTHSAETRKWKAIKSGFTHFQNADIGVAKITPCFENRKSVVFRSLANGIGAGTTELHILRGILDGAVLPEFALWFVKTEAFISGGKEKFSGTAGQQRVGKGYVENALIPIPPQNEQRRVCDAIELAFKQIALCKNSV